MEHCVFFFFSFYLRLIKVIMISAFVQWFANACGWYALCVCSNVAIRLCKWRRDKKQNGKFYRRICIIVSIYGNEMPFRFRIDAHISKCCRVISMLAWEAISLDIETSNSISLVRIAKSMTKFRTSENLNFIIINYHHCWSYHRLVLLTVSTDAIDIKK